MAGTTRKHAKHVGVAMTDEEYEIFRWVLEIEDTTGPRLFRRLFREYVARKYPPPPPDESQYGPGDVGDLSSHQ